MRAGSAGVEQSRGGVSEVLGGHEIIGFDGFFDVIAVNTDRDSHDHVLWTFSDFTVDSQEVGALSSVRKWVRSYLHSLESKVVVVKVLVVDDCRIKFLGVSHDDIVCLLRNHRTEFVVFGIDIGVQVVNDLRKLFFRLLVQIRHCNTAKSENPMKEFTELQGGHSRGVS